MVARAPGVGRRRGNGGAICHGRGVRWACRFAGRRGVVEFLIKSFEHAGGLLAARDAEIEPLLLLQEEDVRIVLAVIAALAAILLSRRRHHRVVHWRRGSVPTSARRSPPARRG